MDGEFRGNSVPGEFFELIFRECTDVDSVDLDEAEGDQG